MSKLTDEQIEQILEAPVSDWTHYCTRNRQYFKRDGNTDRLFVWINETKVWSVPLESKTRWLERRERLEEIITLRQRVQKLEERLQKKRSTIDVSLGDLEQLLKTARNFSRNSRSHVFGFDLVEPKPFISPSLKNEEANYVCYRAIIRRDFHFGWVARFELKEQDDE